MRTHLGTTITQALVGLHPAGKCGESVLKPAIAAALCAAGYSVDVEDTMELLTDRLPAWRSKDTTEVVPTLGRRRVEIVVYKEGRPVALVETESDLKDLRAAGVSKRSGHYDVWSIASSAAGSYFNSYKSLERMATMALYVFHEQRHGRRLRVDEATARATAIRSDLPMDHNPLALPLFLVSGACRDTDHQVLAARLASLDAELLCARQ